MDPRCSRMAEDFLGLPRIAEAGLGWTKDDPRMPQDGPRWLRMAEDVSRIILGYSQEPPRVGGGCPDPKVVTT